VQSAFLKEILTACRENGVHTAIETTGMTDTEMLLETAELLDLVFYDVKHMDDETHREITGASNKKILSNLAAPRFCPA